MSRPRLSGLYAVTRPHPLLVEQVAAALRGGARVVQYRDKSGDPEHKLDEARQLKALCAAAGALFIVNDDPQLAKACHADGVHLGPDDAGIAHAREVLGAGALVGVSCKDSLEAARAAARGGADYLAFGSFFASPTKPDAPRATLDLLRAARAEFGLPLCAIGGVTPQRAAPLVAAGADLVAAVSGVFDAPDVAAAARAYAAAWDNRNDGRRP